MPSVSQILIFVTISFVCLLAVSCEKEKVNQQNTFEGTWYLEEMVFSDDIVKPVNDRKSKNKYELIFESDSTFRMDFNVNRGRGLYLASISDSIKILAYDNITEICCDSEFDSVLRQSMLRVTNYDSVSANQLILFNKDESIVFKR